MTGPDDPNTIPAALSELPHLAEALDDDRFRQFLDHVPFAVAVAELGDQEEIVYGNIEFERLTGLSGVQLEGSPWDRLPTALPVAGGPQLAEAIRRSEEYLGAFTMPGSSGQTVVDAWSNTIVDDGGTPLFRLVAMSARGSTNDADALSGALAEKDTLLKELQHRVKNNLQMITALIRMEARNAQQADENERFNRLAGRIEALSILYRSLDAGNEIESVDLGIYVSQIASSVMGAHASEGIRLDMKVDTWPVSVNVAMPVGLVVNELMTNALKHAFVGREGGEIKVRCTVDERGCRVLVADNGVGLVTKSDWPRQGKLSAMIVQSVRQNAKARIDVESKPHEGLEVTIIFDRPE